MRGGNAEYHPALSARVTAQDNFPRATVADRAHRTARAISPAERLLGIPVNYYGAVEDSTSQRRPRLRELTAPHTLFMGATGSGKTLGMKLHMKSILPPSNPDYAMNFRSLVYDPKSDMIPFLVQIGLSIERDIIVTNPFDRRSAAWDIADDVDNPADGQAFADMVVQNGTGDAFWQVAAREMISATIDGLNARRSTKGMSAWTLRHLVLVLDDTQALRQVLDRTEKGRGVRRDYIDASDGRLRASLNATLRSHVTPFRLIAALWDHAQYRFSLRRWAQGGGLLLVGDHYRYRESAQRANNVLVRYAFDTLMDRPGEERRDLTWLYLDELKNAGKFPNFGTMLTQGRSKGIRSVLAAQGLSTLRATFAENEEHEVLNNTGNKALMQLGSDEDAAWAERLFSTVERLRKSWNVPDDYRQQGSTTYSEVRESRVPASAFLNLPSASDQDGVLAAFYHGPGAQASRSTVSQATLARVLPQLRSTGSAREAFVPQGKSAFLLRPLSSGDRDQLGLSESNNGQPGETGSRRRFHAPPSK